MALVFLLFIPLPLYFIPGMTASSSSLPFSLQAIYYIVMAVPQIGIVIYLLSLQKAPWPVFGFKKPRWSTVGWAAAGWGGALMTAGTIGLLTYLLPEAVRREITKAPPFALGSWAEIPLLLLFCIAIGYREELLFRAYFIPRLGELGVKPVWAVLGTSIVFASMHFNQGVVGVAGTFAIGVLFGVVFAWRRDLHAVAWAHAFYNFYVVVMQYVVEKIGLLEKLGLKP